MPARDGGKTVVLRGLRAGTTEATVRQYFDFCGTIVEIDQRGAVWLVEFGTALAAQTAELLSPVTLDGCTEEITVHRIESAAVPGSAAHPRESGPIDNSGAAGATGPGALQDREDRSSGTDRSPVQESRNRGQSGPGSRTGPGVEAPGSDDDPHPCAVLPEQVAPAGDAERAAATAGAFVVVHEQIEDLDDGVVDSAPCRPPEEDDDDDEAGHDSGRGDCDRGCDRACATAADGAEDSGTRVPASAASSVIASALFAADDAGRAVDDLDARAGGVFARANTAIGSVVGAAKSNETTMRAASSAASTIASAGKSFNAAVGSAARAAVGTRVAGAVTQSRGWSALMSAVRGANHTSVDANRILNEKRAERVAAEMRREAQDSREPA